MTKINLVSALKSLGIANELISNAINDWFILQFNVKDKSVLRLDFDDSEKCYEAFQNLCVTFENASHKNPHLEVDFPNEEWNEAIEEPAGYGNVIVTMRDGVVTDLFELVNPEYYV